MNDGDLRDALRRDMPASEAPPFESTWHAAETRYKGSRRRNAALAGVAATLAAVAVIVTVLVPDSEQVAYIEIAELLETTSWQAPSDTLMPEREFDIFQELPVLMESTDEAGGALL